jgi:thioredoxin reductase (NADPH)
MDAAASASSGEVAQLSSGIAFVDAEADDVEALLIPLRALIVAEAELGGRIVRTLILRRVAHIESGGSGPVLNGALQSPDMRRCCSRNTAPAPVMCWSRVRTT